MEREYAATVDVPELGIEPGEALIQTLSKGVVTADGTYEADVAAIEGREVNIVVREGKHRMVRRCDKCVGAGLTAGQINSEEPSTSAWHVNRKSSSYTLMPSENVSECALGTTSVVVM